MESPVKLQMIDTMDLVPVDLYRGFIFPNNIREIRRKSGIQKLIGLSHRLPQITYIRLSKIERGEVVARAQELVEIASALSVSPDALLIDCAHAEFLIEDWAAPFLHIATLDLAQERFAVLVAAAVRHIRGNDRNLTIQTITERHGIAPVNLSRIENAQRCFDEWNGQTRTALVQMFGARDEDELRIMVEDLYRCGTLTPWLTTVCDPTERLRRTCDRVQALQAELSELRNPDPDRGQARGATLSVQPSAAPTMIAVRGVAGPDGLVVDQDTGDRIAQPPGCGANVFALRLCRPSLGAGLPGQSILFVDPDRYPVAGGLAVVREGDGFRVLAIATDMDGGMVGHSQYPPRRLELSAVAATQIHAVVAAKFI